MFLVHPKTILSLEATIILLIVAFLFPTMNLKAQTIYPILDSNAGEIQEVLISRYYETIDCRSLKKAVNDSVVSFLLRKGVKVCLVPHFKYCLTGYIGDDDFVCKEIEDKVEEDPNVQSLMGRYNSLYAQIQGNLDRQELNSWLDSNNLKNIGLSVKGSELGVLKTFFSSPYESALAIKQLINNSETPLSYNLNKDANVSEILITVGNQPIEVDVFESNFVFDKRPSKKIRNRLINLIEADHALFKAKIRSREQIISNLIFEQVLSSSDDLIDSLNLRVDPEIEVINCNQRPARISSRHLDDQIGRWMQDKVHVRKKGADDFELGVINEHQKEGYENLKQYLKIGPGCFKNDLVESERLRDVAGGNYFKIDNILFIGKDELKKYQTSDSAFHHLRAENKSRTSIENAIVESVFGTPDMGNLIWVGVNDSILSQSSNSCEWCYQPFYHIDLFFHPLGRIGQNREFKILVAEPEYLNVDGEGDIATNLLEAKLVDFKKAISSIKLTVSNNLSSMGYSVDWISIPVALDYYPNYNNKEYLNCAYADRILSPINGISSRKKTEITYYLPVDTELTEELVKKFYIKVFDYLDGLSLEDQNVFIQKVNGDFGRNDALNCLVKVVKRQRTD